MSYSEKFARRFLRSYKRCHPNQLRDVHQALERILLEPTIGKPKKGVLAGLLVYKFSAVGQEFLIAYTLDDLKKEVTFEAAGPHENFYRDLKR